MKRTEIERLLPGVFQRTVQTGTPLFALLEVMEELHAVDEAALDHLETFFDPRRASDAFVLFLANWVDLGWLLTETPTDFSMASTLPLPPGNLRELVAAAASLTRWRGTARGLLTFLETATGVKGFVIEEQVAGADGRIQPFHIRILVPQEASSYQTLIERIVEEEKPAYVTCEFRTGNAPNS